MATKLYDPQSDWDDVDALLGGTRALRQLGQKYMPKRPNEEDEHYTLRKTQATLFPAYSETLNNLTGRVFSEPLTFSDTPQWILDEVKENADKQGRSLDVVAHEWFHMALAYGMQHLLVESPDVQDLRTLGDQERMGVRPYTILVSHRSVIGWSERDGEITRVKLRLPVGTESDQNLEDDKSKSESIEELRTYQLVHDDNGTTSVLLTVEVEDGVDAIGKKKFTADNRRTRTLRISKIPLVTLYTKRLGVFSAIPPLMELAHLNLKHWRLQSYMDLLIDTVTVPILTITGVDDDGNKVTIGSRAAVKLPMGAAMNYVEHTGKAVESGAKEIATLKEEMRVAGAKLLSVDRQMTKTATQSREEATRENSVLGRMVTALEDALATLMDTIAMWRTDVGGKVKVNANLDPDLTPGESIGVLNAMANDGRLSDQTVFEEAQRRGMLKPELKWEEEQSKIENSVAMKFGLLEPKRDIPGEDLDPNNTGDDIEDEGTK